jgi:hypothetical protein
MFGGEISAFSFWIVAIAICIILLIILGLLSRFCAKAQEANKDQDANLIGLSGQIKKLQGTLSELLGEQRRMNKLMLELLELKKAEMTGDFEIVEEPITLQTPKASVQEEINPSTPQQTVNAKLPEL